MNTSASGNAPSPRISFRINVARWQSDERFRELMDTFERYRGVVDEITFFTSYTHAALPIEVISDRAAVLAGRMRTVREFGYAAGINHLPTIGHHSEDLSRALAGEYVCVTDPDGRTARGVLCPNDEHVRDYIRRSYEILTAAEPDYIWIDDDIRLCDHLPVAVTCFCGPRPSSMYLNATRCESGVKVG